MTSARGPVPGTGASLAPVSRWELALVAALLAAFGATVAVMIAAGLPLTYDEAVYAARAREFVSGPPAITWHVFRPVGLPLLGTLAAPLGFSEFALRSLTLALGLIALFSLWTLARVTLGPWTALLALGVVAFAPSVLEAASLFLNDLGSAGLVLSAMALLWVELERRPAPTWRLLLVPALWAGAFYLRYGSVMFLAAVGAVSLALWWRQLYRQRALTGAALAVLTVLLVPHVVEAVAVTGSPWGTLLEARVATREAPVVDTVGRYLGWLLDGTLAGPLGPPLIALGVSVGPLLVLTGWRDATLRRRTRALLFMGLTALLVSVLIATSAAPEARYVFLPLFLGLIIGSASLVEVVRGLAAASGAARLAPASVALLGVLILGWGAFAVGTAVREARDWAAVDRWKADAARTIVEDSGGRCSLVVSWPLRPTFYWYAACPTVAGPTELPLLTPWEDDGGRGYVVVHSDTSPPRKLPPQIVDAYRDLASGPPIAEYDRNGLDVAEILRIGG